MDGLLNPNPEPRRDNSLTSYFQKETDAGSSCSPRTFRTWKICTSFLQMQPGLLEVPELLPAFCPSCFSYNLTQSDLIAAFCQDVRRGGEMIISFGIFFFLKSPYGQTTIMLPHVIGKRRQLVVQLFFFFWPHSKQNLNWNHVSWSRRTES